MNFKGLSKSKFFDAEAYEEAQGFQISPVDSFAHALMDETRDKGLTRKEALSRNMRKLYEADAKYRFENKLNRIIAIQGPTGSGKSSGALRVMYDNAQWFQRPFTLDHMVDNSFSLQRLLAEEDELDKGDCLIMDEEDKGMFGVGAMRALLQSNDTLVRIRAEQIDVVYCSRIVHLACAHYYWDCVGIDKAKSKVAYLWYVPVGGVRKLIGSVWLDLPSKQILDDYFAGFKARSLKGARAGKTDDRVGEWEWIADKVLERGGFEDCKNAMEREMFIMRTPGVPTVTKNELKYVLVILKDKLNLDTFKKGRPCK